jgi:ribosome-binding protein aMBF1 (putative translation factor)
MQDTKTKGHFKVKRPQPVRGSTHPATTTLMPEDVRRLVGRNVRRLRIREGLSQAKVSELMGLNRAYVSGLERGERNPTIITLWHTSRALGVKLQELTTERGQSR